MGVHTPSEVKAAISGSGRADKAQVGLMVARVLHLEKPPTPADAADALALAITHIWRGGTQSRIEAAMAVHQHSPARTWRQRSAPRTRQEHHLR